ncbi:hypothetical protein KSF_112240 [Reticulibacter mediterranei]|uniref:DUF2269 domain-containing protein n=1 Tax=Reticulibacter mediterranei TaxID=2778369 RepID=A0A8J3J421_9CHLR|nr:hypothetical protein [Reticulibacter mediterranei]GHP01177.1 hypothetical protein KSF_112240 [Reticulibacter mediterranei]
MTSSSSFRKLSLTIHITSSLGWFGAVAVFLALAVTEVSSQDQVVVRAASLVMSVTTWSVIVPFALLSGLTGVISSLSSKWGLMRYYWVLFKLAITLVITLILFVHTRPIDLLAQTAATTPPLLTRLHGTQIQLVIASSAALVVLLVLTVLSIYKPRGMTRYGWRTQNVQRHKMDPEKQRSPDSLLPMKERKHL